DGGERRATDPRPSGDRRPPRRRRGRRQGRRLGAHRQRRAGRLRAASDAGDRLRPAGARHVRLAPELHQRQRGRLARRHGVAALRRLPRRRAPAGHARRVQGGGVGQLRAAGGRLRADLLGGGRAARRPARHRGHADRRALVHLHRTRAGGAPGRRGARRPIGGLPAGLARAVPLRAAGNEPALCGHLPRVQRLRAVPLPRGHGGPRRQDRAAPALRHAGAGAGDAAPAVHGREARPRLDLGNPLGRRAAADRPDAGRGPGRADHAALLRPVAPARRPDNAGRDAGNPGQAALQRRGPLRRRPRAPQGPLGRPHHARAARSGGGL
ncbi:MAG: Flagellar motor switch protein FliM, partial [uncultured Acetobacteraceae bacterium]